MFRFASAVLVVLAAFLLFAPSGVEVDPSSSFANPVQQDRNTPPAVHDRNDLMAQYSQLPLEFEANQGQSDPRVQFLARGHGYTLFLTGGDAVLELRKGESPRATPFTVGNSRQSPSSLVRMRLVAAKSGVTPTGVDELPGKSNYFIGNDPSKWRSGISNYAKVKYQNVYPGIDLLYYGRQGQLEYDFVLAPGADSAAIRLELTGVPSQSLHIDSAGAIVGDTSAGELCFHKPVIYQASSHNGKRRVVDGHYKLLADNRVGFEISSYDKSKELIIDPVLNYATFLGGSNADAHDSVSVAFDSSGNAYVASGTISTDFPVTAGAYQSAFGGAPAICDQATLFCGDALVTKINAAGTAILYSTYLGGNDSDYAYGLAVDSSGNAYVAGLTKSTNFPVTAGAFQPSFGGTPSVCDDYVCGDAFITKLNSTGSALVYSSYLGGSGNEHPEGLAIDSHGNAYLTGDTGSTDFPTTPGAFQTQLKGNNTCTGRSGAPALCHNAFLTKINATGTQKMYSTYLGGTTGDGGGGVAVDGSGRASVVGSTCSSDFPVTGGAFQHATAGGCDIFVTTFNTTGTHLVYSTYFGGSGYEAAYSAATDSAGNVYFSGFTYSNDFPVSAGAAQTVLGGNADALMAKFNPQLAGSASLVYATYLGGDLFEIAGGTAVDSQGNAYSSGESCSANFPLVNPLQAAKNGGCDAFVTELNPTGSAFVFSTFLGGSGPELADFISIDSGGNAYVAGPSPRISRQRLASFSPAMLGAQRTCGWRKSTPRTRLG